MSISSASVLSSGLPLDYQIGILSKVNDNAKLQGDNALKLIESAGQEALPPNATISVRA